MFKIKNILIGIFLIVIKNVSAQNEILPYQQDLNKYWELITNYHPSEKSDSLELLKDSLLQSITPKTNLVEFYQILSTLNSQLHCVHTGVYLPNQTVLDLKLKPIFLPYFFKITTDSIFVLINDKYQNVLAIDGKKSPIILERLRNCIRNDNNIYYENNIINRAFPVLYSLYINSENKHVINLKDSSLVIKGVVSNEMSKKYIEKNQMASIYSSRILNDKKVAYLKMGSFDINYLKSKKINAKKIVNNFFKLVKDKDIPRIILDLRGNSGGTAKIPEQLLKYLSQKPYTFFEKVKYKQDNYAPYVNLTKGSFKKEKNYFIRKKNFTYTSLSRVHKDSYKGTIYLLINSANVSMAVAFIEKIINTNNNVILIGEPVGGNFNFNAGLFINEELNKSKIKVKIPIEQIVVDSLQDNYLIVPNLPIKDNQFIDNNGKIIFPFLIDLIKQHNLWNGNQ